MNGAVSLILQIYLCQIVVKSPIFIIIYISGCSGSNNNHDSVILHSKNTPALRFAISSNTLLVATSHEGEVKIWSTQSGELLNSFEFDTFNKTVPFLAFSPNDRYLAASSSTGTIVWQLEDNVVERKNMSPGGSVVFSPSSDLVAINSPKSIDIWEITTGNIIYQLAMPSGSPPKVEYVSLIAFSPDGSLIAATRENGILIWNIMQDNVSSIIERGRKIAFTSDNQRLIVAGGGQATTWQVKTGALVNSIQTDSFLEPAILSDKEFIIGITNPYADSFNIVSTRSSDPVPSNDLSEISTLSKWNINTGNQIWQKEVSGVDFWFRQVEVSQDESMLGFLNGDGNVHLIPLEN